MLENRDGAYLNKSLCRYRTLPREIGLGNAVKSNFLIDMTILVSLFLQEGSCE